MTFRAALRCDRITVRRVVDAPINDESLVRTVAPIDAVVMEKFGGRIGQGLRAAISAAGALLLVMPQYHSDLSLIERVFAKGRHLPRAADKRTA